MPARLHFLALGLLVALGLAQGARAAPIEVVSFEVRAVPNTSFPDPGIEISLAFADGSAFVPNPGDPFVGIGTNFRGSDPIGTSVLRRPANEPDFESWSLFLTDGIPNRGELDGSIPELWIRVRGTSEGSPLNGGFMQGVGFLFHECQFFTALGASFGGGACSDPDSVDLQGFELSGVRFELLAVDAPGAPAGALDLGVTILALPEPSTALLVWAGLFALALRERRS